MWKLLDNPPCLRKCSRFSPLAGIRYVETADLAIGLFEPKLGFSPLAGIRYVETLALDTPNQLKSGFSPLAGIRYVETIVYQ